MVCQNCGNHFEKAAVCSDCAAVLAAFAALRPRAHPARCGTCRVSWTTIKRTGRLGCPNCYEHFLAQVKDLLPRVHAGAYQHRGKTPGRR